ncbi:hypothetical protein P153DRAFT_365948 [Dothidotthia symphoricarpi CBS 119687]|uniref:50S ribosomal protein-like protein YmL27 n=1 Tax=Dothidotthia symphoricarpi CBS 119687 TaxID=1392245 RepID=A0A6A6AHE9_9PLEO|nr:uncharacterized protein P153DRAFT_365948 [Dothidotthia symphoricarpi CBS 119687]KAF2130334.1 hypothetical protein P153DRAFT_365948 [Dothidotthia symphoricarpi CBS 119687]
MFRATPSLQKTLRRLPLSPKQAGVEYYKGNRVGNLGSIDEYGNFAPDWAKIRTYVYPLHGTKNTELTPFVGLSIETTRRSDMGESENYPKRFTGEDYLRAWKTAGGHDLVEGQGEAGPRVNMPEPFEEKTGTKA